MPAPPVQRYRYAITGYLMLTLFLRNRTFANKEKISGRQ